MSGQQITEERSLFLKKDYERGFIKYCGFKALEVSWGKFRSKVEIRPHHRQQDGFIHAGVMAAMADHTAGYASFTIVPQNMQILTVEFKINFLKPAFGETLICRSEVIRGGRRIIVAESEVLDVRGDESTPVAKALVTLTAVAQEKLKSR